MTSDSALRIIATNGADRNVGAVMREIGKRARAAARKVALAPAEQRNAALLAMAEALRARTSRILAANAQDLADGKAAGQVTKRLQSEELELHAELNAFSVRLDGEAVAYSPEFATDAERDTAMQRLREALAPQE